MTKIYKNCTYLQKIISKYIAVLKLFQKKDSAKSLFKNNYDIFMAN